MMVLVLLICHRLIEIVNFILVVYALMSWIPGAIESGLGQMIGALIEPLIEPFRRMNLQCFGLDFTILAVFIALECLDRLLIFLLL